VPSIPGIGQQDSEVLRGVSKYWWLWLVFGIVWIAAAVVILQFDRASITTVGIIVGIMFFGAAGQNFALASFTEGGMRWVFVIFAGLFTAAGVIELISPENTSRRWPTSSASCSRWWDCSGSSRPSPPARSTSSGGWA
jgi:hypothetical protein